MQSTQKIGMRILLPAISVTAIFSISLFFIGRTVLNHLAQQRVNQIVQTKIADIATDEKRVANELLTQASLFSQDKAVLAAYETAYQGDLQNSDDPQMELARQQLNAYFTSIDKGYKEIHNGKSLRLHFHVPPARSLLRLWKKTNTKVTISVLSEPLWKRSAEITNQFPASRSVVGGLNYAE